MNGFHPGNAFKNHSDSSRFLFNVSTYKCLKMMIFYTIQGVWGD